MVLTWPAIQYPIKIESILGIWTTNLLIPTMDVELMGGHIRTRGGICLPMPQGLTYVESHPHALHDQNIVVAPYGWTGTLCHLPGGSFTDSGYYQTTP